MNKTTVSLDFKIANDNLSKFNEILATKKSSLTKLIIDHIANLVAQETEHEFVFEGTLYEPHKGNDVTTLDFTTDHPYQCQCCNVTRLGPKQQHLSKNRFDGISLPRCKTKTKLLKVKCSLGYINIFMYACPRHVELAKEGYTFRPHITASSYLGGRI